MYSVQPILRGGSKVLRAFQPVRNAPTTAVVSLPRNRMPLAEKAVHGLIIASAILATPIWVLLHLDDYRKGRGK